MDEVILASAIANVPHLAAFDKMAAKRFSSIELEQLLIYVIDTVDASALPWLATQFNVLGYRGMRLAVNEQQQREVIKNAISVARYSGTPWAVKQALKAIGYPDAIITENAGTGPHGWAQFRIDLDTGDNEISVEKISELTQMVNIYKGARNHVLPFNYLVNFSDGFVITDDHHLEPGIDEREPLLVGIARFANGEYIADGSIDASSDSDSLTMEVIVL